MHGTKMWWRAQQHNIDVGVQQSREPVKAPETMLLVNRDLFGDPLLS